MKRTKRLKIPPHFLQRHILSHQLNNINFLLYLFKLVCHKPPPLFFSETELDGVFCARLVRSGEGGIRTHGDVSATCALQAHAFDHSATSPFKTSTIHQHLFRLPQNLPVIFKSKSLYRLIITYPLNFLHFKIMIFYVS